MKIGRSAMKDEVVPGTQALTRGIQVLKAISAGGRHAQLASLQAKTGLARPTLHRILKALTAEGLVRVDPKDNTLQLGLTFLRLASQVLEQFDIRELAHEDLLRLSRLTSEAVHLAVPDGREVVYIDLVESGQPVGPIGRLGSSSTLFAAASGKVVAAHLPQEFIERLLVEEKLIKFTKNTITSVRILKQQFQTIRTQGYAVNEEEEVLGIRGVAAPIFDMSGQVVASVGITIPSYRYKAANLKFYTSSAIQAARAISSKLLNPQSN